MSEKRITVFIPAYNAGMVLKNSLSKVVNQTRQPDEIIVVDDGSNDNTFEIISIFAEKHSNIKVIKNRTNQGLTKIALDAIHNTKGEYFCGIGADDPLHDGFIEAAMSQLEKYPEAGLCCAEYRSQYTNGNSKEIRINLSDKPKYFSPTDYAVLLSKRREVSLATCTTIWKKSVLLELGGVIPTLRWHYDWFNAVVIAFRYGFCYIPKIYQTVNFDPLSYSQAGQRDWNQQSLVLNALLQILEQPEFSDVKPYFRIPAIISKFGPLLLGVLLEKKEWHDYLSWELIQYVLDQDVGMRNTEFSLRNKKLNEFTQKDIVQISREVVAGLSAQYRTIALDKNRNENESQNYSVRADILEKSDVLTDKYAGLAFRYHDYWRESQYLDVRRWIHLIKELPKNIRVAIYGTGQFGRDMRKMLLAERNDVQVLYFVDRVSIDLCDELEVLLPTQIKDLMGSFIDCILLCSIYYDEIYPELEKIGIRDIACVDAGEVLKYYNV